MFTKFTFLFFALLRIVGGVLNLVCSTGEVMGINDLKIITNKEHFSQKR